MKKDDQLKKALDALGLIETSTWGNIRTVKDFAGRIYNEITAPRMETVEETIYSVVFPEGYFHVFKTRFDADSSAAYGKGKVFEHVIKHHRPVEEKEPEVWEREVVGCHIIPSYITLPERLVGSMVEVRLKEEE